MTTRSARDERQLGVGIPLSEFRRAIGNLGAEERERTVMQALLLIDQLYVHLPLKRAMHAVDPVQRLRVLRTRAPELTERQFHDEMIAIFTGLRDLHTRYILPAPYRGRAATLSFRVQEFIEGDRRRYVVTEVDPQAIPDPRFEVGVLVTHWNGIPMTRAVEVNADRQAGGNVHARHARGLNTMTKRPIDTSALPDEDWVVVGYEGREGDAREVRIEWRVLEPEPASTAVDPHEPQEQHALALGLDVETEVVRRTRKIVFSPDRVRTEARVAALADQGRIEPGSGPPGMPGETAFPDALEFERDPVPTAHGRFGYLRIRSFLVRDVRAFVTEVVRILGLLPQEGLILDVRGNPGGVIMNGELLLQLFTPRQVEPERLHFINTPLTRQLCQTVPELKEWEPSVAASVETAMTFSDGYPLTRREACNALGQHYHGPVVLVTDALCYSATDIFIAGWQDHRVGPILGTSGNTGAGGANVWEHGDLLRCFEGAASQITPLPGRASFSVAARRTTRVGDRSGAPLEDLGVIPDRVHDVTLRDLLHGNPDLLAHAGEILAERPVRALVADPVGRDDGPSAGVTVTTRGITRLDAYLDGRPLESRDVTDGATDLEVPTQPGSSPTLELRGFDGAELVAARRLPL